ncbi:MAG: phosphomannomutase/phosphoglucomutase [Gemmatimonadota bacterium]|nr:MAG: phosphomannomutase/phosphoglucomutase [Gemmatimonadota bacterium]
MRAPRHVFREYDIRGIVDETLDPELARAVGLAFGSELGQGATVAVGQDNRPSSPTLASALVEGLNASGVDVLFVGTVPTPALYFAAYELGTAAGVQITGSHNPPEYNGIKLTRGERALYGEAIQRLRLRIEADDFLLGGGTTSEVEILDRYVEEIGRRARVDPPIRFVLDCGNGAGSIVAADALRAAGAEVDPLYCESDGTFPNHHPDPTVDENVQDLIARVIETGAAFGVGLDGDADRIGAVTEEGAIIRGDHLLLLFALDVLQDHPGADIVFDVKCSKALPEMISKAGGNPVMWRTGHSLIKERMRELGSPLSGEMSGHICFADRYFGIDDAIYDAARLAELVARDGRPLSEIVRTIPAYPSTPELRLDCPEERKFELVRRAVQHYKQAHDVVDIDGARVQFEGGWALIRASNTQPVVVVRLEADSPERLREIHGEISEYLAAEGVSLPDV